MLTALQVGNFKAFAESQHIPIRPLTLIYGANSAGKSSIIHSLLLASHAIQTGNLDVHLTRLGGDSVDLGGFQQFIHRRDETRRMEWAVTLDSSMFAGKVAEMLAPVPDITMSVQIGITSVDRGSQSPYDRPGLHTYELSALGRSMLRMSRRRDGNLQLDRLDHEHPVFHEIIKAMVISSTTTESISPEDYEGLDDVISDLVPEIIARSERFLPVGLIKSKVSSDPHSKDMLFLISKGSRKDNLAEAIRFFLPRKVSELLGGIAEAIRNEIDNLSYLGPLRSFPSRHVTLAKHQDPNWFSGGGYAWDVVVENSQIRSQINEWLSSTERLQTPYEIMIRKYVDLDQLDAPLWQAFDVLGISGLEMKPDEDPSNQWGAYPVVHDIDEEVARTISTIQDSGIATIEELVLNDCRSDTKVSHRDVGVGISQVLPVLVGAYASENKLVAIEQPEIHLHPKLQAELGDVFIDSALGERKNTFLLETHSEHLLLRIMKRMRQTASGDLPEGVSSVRPEDVAVLFVEPDGHRSIVREMPLNERGELVKAWPGGFFEEGLQEIF